MTYGVSPTKNAVVIAHTTGSCETFVIESITSIQFYARSGNDPAELQQRLVDLSDHGGKSRRSTIALLGSRRVGSILRSKQSRRKPSPNCGG